MQPKQDDVDKASTDTVSMPTFRLLAYTYLDASFRSFLTVQADHPP